MKNITVSVDDELYRQARIRAAEQGTSVSRVVKETLTTFVAQPSSAEQRKETLKKLYAEVDARMKGTKNRVVYPGWRGDMYDERFDETVLGRSLKPENAGER